MKTGIHPDYTPAKITCACGRVTETSATVNELHVEICSHCHPFFTGRQKLVDTAGRVERFRRKYSAASPEASTTTEVVDEEKEAAEAVDEEKEAAQESDEETPASE